MFAFSAVKKTWKIVYGIGRASNEQRIKEAGAIEVLFYGVIWGRMKREVINGES